MFWMFFFQPPCAANLRKAKCQQIFDKQVFRRDPKTVLQQVRQKPWKLTGPYLCHQRFVRICDVKYGHTVGV